jgi:pimeloyl-ACP methyl ester carboxylesterase
MNVQRFFSWHNAVSLAVPLVAIIFTNCAAKTAAAQEKTYTYTTETIYCSNNGKNIYGIVYIPAHTLPKMPLVIFSHGYSGTNAVGKIYAESLARNGIAAYCFDFCGGSPQSKSDGETTDMSVFTEKSDLEAVVSMMQSQKFVDSNNIFLMGESQGGVISAMTAAEQPDDIRGLILLYPAFVISGSAEQNYKSVNEIPDEINFLGMRIGRRYYEDIWGYNIYDHIGAYTRNVLLIHGNRDELVPLAYSERALKIYPSAELKIIPGAGHGFYGKNAETVIAFILEYIRQNLSNSITATFEVPQ